MNAGLQTATEEERQWGMYGHLAGLLAFTGVPFGGVIGPWVLYLLNRPSRPFAAEQARNALNFHLTIGVVQFVCFLYAIFGYFAFFFSGFTGVRNFGGFFGSIFVAFAIYAASFFWGFVLTLVGTVRASHGELYRYPLTIDIVR